MWTLSFYSASRFGLQHGERFLVNVSTLLSGLNFTAMQLDINKTKMAAEDAIKKVV